MTRRMPAAVLLSIVLLFLTFALGAATHRATMPPGQGSELTDALGIGPMSGAAVSGSVASVQGTTITLNSGGAPAIRIDASAAKFMGQTGAGSISDVKPGVRVTAFINTTAAIAPGTPLPAQLITIESLPDLAATGSLQAIDVPNSKFTVLGISMAVDSNTSFSSAFPTFAPIKGLGDLVLGQVVNVTAAFAVGSILAKRIQILAPVVPTPVIISGTVKSISASAWVITGKDGKDLTVIVDAQTKIIGDPKAGDSVQVMANLDASHNYVAIAIVKLGTTVPPPTNIIELHGFVKSISATQWTIGGPPGSMAPDFLVKITSTTVIYPNPAVGDRVIVVGTRDSAGTVVALKIGKEG
jgi:hypothetical protein